MKELIEYIGEVNPIAVMFLSLFLEEDPARLTLGRIALGRLMIVETARLDDLERPSVPDADSWTSRYSWTCHEQRYWALGEVLSHLFNFGTWP